MSDELILRRYALDRYLPLQYAGSITVAAAEYHQLKYIEWHAAQIVSACMAYEDGDDGALTRRATAMEDLRNVMGGNNANHSDNR